MPAYNDTPTAAQRISASQSLIQTNFASLSTVNDVNHVPITDAQAGKHIKVDFTNSATHPAVSATDVLLYNYDNALTAQQELYVKRTGALATAGVPFTARGGTTVGWTYLPSGLLMKWGFGSATAGLYTYTFPVGATIPAFTTIYNMQVTTSYVNVSDGDGFVRLNAFAAPWTTFTVYASHRTTSGAFGPVAFSYLAIGV